MRKYQSYFIIIPALIFAVSLILASCMIEGEIISSPDEFTRVFEAGENTVIRAIVQVFKDKGFGNATINPENNQVDSDYIVQEDWRSKSTARVKKVNWKECEVALSVITEKKTSQGWEMRRLLEKKQYDNFFDDIELQIYQELYKIK